VLSLVRMISSRSLLGRLRRSRVAVVVVGVGVGMLGLGASAAYASFQSSPLLDNFAADTSLLASWTTPALGEGSMTLNTADHELEGVPGNWDAALWNASFSAPVEVWTTIGHAGTHDVNLYVDDTGGRSGRVHSSSAYFADFGGTNSKGSPRQVSIWRIDAPKKESKLTFVSSPYTNLQPGDEIGLSVGTNGVEIAWYKPVGGSWSAVVSWHDTRYRSGEIALETLPSASYGFTNFGGGTPRTPVVSAITTTSIASSARKIKTGQRVTYTVKVSRGPDGGTVSFADKLVPIPGCGAQRINGSGKAACTVTYKVPGSHSVSARYSGSPDGAFAGSATIATAAVVVGGAPVVSRPALSVANRRLIVTVSCPSDSGGCRITPDIGIALPGVRSSITLSGPSARLNAGRAGTLTSVLKGKAQAELSSDLHRHHPSHLDVTVHLTVRYGNGTIGTQAFAYTVRGAGQLALL